MVPTVKPRSLAMPAPVPAPFPGASVSPAARRSSNHVVGAVVGGRVEYRDLNAFAWYLAGGYLTLNRGRKRIGRTFRGAEDGRRERR
jgi:hypothetical protein